MKCLCEDAYKLPRIIITLNYSFVVPIKEGETYHKWYINGQSNKMIEEFMIILHINAKTNLVDWRIKMY